MPVVSLAVVNQDFGLTKDVQHEMLLNLFIIPGIFRVTLENKIIINKMLFFSLCSSFRLNKDRTTPRFVFMK